MPPWSEVLKPLLVTHEQLLIGWLLGLLSPALIETIRKARRVSLLEQALAQELHELQYQMFLKAFIFRQRAAKLDDEFLLWLEEIGSGYKGREVITPFLELWRELRKVDISKRGQLDPKRGFNLSEAEAPLLLIHTNEIALFSVSSQVWLLGVARHVSLFNQQVSYLHRQFDRTFDNLSDVSRAAVKQNLEDGYETLAQRAVVIANLIKAAPSSLRA